MATNYIQEGNEVFYTNSGAAIASGDVVPMTNRCGVALEAIAASTGTGRVQLDGVWKVTKKTGEAWAMGEALYWDASPGEATTTASGNTPLGWAFAAAESADATGRAQLAGKFVQGEAAVQAALAGTLTGTVDGTLADVAAIALSTTNTYTDAAVNSAVNTAITSVNLQLKELQTVLNAVISKLKAAGLMASS